MNQTVRAIVASVSVLGPLSVQAGQELLHLAIGDPARKGREVPVVLDGITDTATGQAITPGELVERLAGTGILFIGENHTNQSFHDVQLRTIQALHAAGRQVLIGLEMFPYTEQASLDHWIAGRYTEPGFVELADWYRHWGYNWRYYRDIFLFARDQGIPMYAINSPREVVRAARQKGFGSLTPEEAAHLPPTLAPDSKEHQRMYRAFFSEDDALHMSADALDGLYRAQTTWDATMGWNALQALKAHGGPDAIMVVLIGAGHATYGLGSERQIAPHYDGRIASLIPVETEDDSRAAIKTVRASYANFVWGLPREVDTVYPSLGISLMGSLGKEPGQIIQVSKGSVAERAGLQVGDVLLSLDGTPVSGEPVLRRVQAGYQWGDVASARIRRDDGEIDLPVAFRRSGAPQSP